MFCRRDLILLKLRTWFEEYFPLHFLENNSIKEPHRESTSVNTEFTYSSRPKMCRDWDFFAAFSVQNTPVSKTTRHLLWWTLNLKLVSFWNQGFIKIPKTNYSSPNLIFKTSIFFPNISSSSPLHQKYREDGIAPFFLNLCYILPNSHYISFHSLQLDILPQQTW